MGIYQIKRANICYHDYYDDSCVMDFGNHCMLEIRWMFDNVWSRSNNDQGFICGCGTFAEPVRRFASAFLETLFSEDTSCQLSKTSKILKNSIWALRYNDSEIGRKWSGIHLRVRNFRGTGPKIHVIVVRNTILRKYKMSAFQNIKNYWKTPFELRDTLHQSQRSLWQVIDWY